MNPCEVDGKVYDPRPWSQMICPNHALCTRDDEEIGLHCGPHPQYESCAYGADGCPACVSTANAPADLPGGESGYDPRECSEISTVDGLIAAIHATEGNQAMVSGSFGPSGFVGNLIDPNVAGEDALPARKDA